MSLRQVSNAIRVLFQVMAPACPNRPGTNLEHIRAGISWLSTAQEATGEGGVSKGFAPHRGWLPSYVETTGYIIPTMFDCFKRFGWQDCRRRALQMAEWELSRQYTSGAFPGCQINAGGRPLVFDTGMVLFGLTRTYEETGDKRFQSAAERAGNWLLDSQETSGEWRKATLNNQPRAYHARVAWALLNLSRLADRDKYQGAAIRNLRWTTNQQFANGWFENNSFFGEDNALTHTIAYATRGLLESGVILQEDRYIEAAMKTARAVRNLQRSDGSVPGSFGRHWQPTLTFTCLSGNAQIAIIWLRLFQLTGDRPFLEAASRTIDYLKGMQNMTTPCTEIKGAIPATHPIFRGYMRFFFSNWAVKFLVDSLLEIETLRDSYV